MSDQPTPSPYATVVPDMGDFAALAQHVKALEERVAALEEGATAPEAPTTPSADGAKAYDAGTVLVDDDLHSWRITPDRTIEWMPEGASKWADAGYTADVAVIEKWKATCYQSNAKGDWYYWDHNTPWVKAPGDPSAPPPDVEPIEGAYSVRDGYIVDARGQRFIAQGFCLLDRFAHVAVSGPKCKPLLDHYPSCNFLHIMPWLTWPIYTWPQEAINLVEWATAKGIICEIGNWWTWPVVPTGDLLTQECAWYADLARRYKDNSRVWFSSCNEPQDWYVGLPPGSITQEHVAVYKAIRDTGSNTIIGLLGTGGTMADGLTPTSAYQDMRNIHWDTHFYPWLSGASGDYQTCVNAVYGVANSLQSIRSGDGVVPCIFGEIGNATDGAHVDDWNGTNVQAVLDVSQRDYNGVAAFCGPFWPADTGGQPNADQIADEWVGGLTPYGHQVQSSYASSSQVAMQSAQANKTWPLRDAFRQAAEKWKAEHGAPSA